MRLASFARTEQIIFEMSDYDCDGDLEMDEFLMSMKSAEAGLARMRGESPAAERRIVDLAHEWYALLKPEGASKCSLERVTQWLLSPLSPANKVLLLYAEAEGSVDVDSDVEAEGQPSIRTPAQLLQKVDPGDSDKDTNSQFTTTPRGGGDEFMAVRPYLGAIKAPTSALKRYPLSPPPPPHSASRTSTATGPRTAGTTSTTWTRGAGTRSCTSWRRCR